jgi:hypothetical protein
MPEAVRGENVAQKRTWCVLGAATGGGRPRTGKAVASAFPDSVTRSPTRGFSALRYRHFMTDTATNTQYLSLTALRERGWTSTMIAALLGAVPGEERVLAAL